MESSESESSGTKVQELQAALFPPTPRGLSSYFSNFFIKPSACEDDDLKKQNEIKENVVTRELFSINRENIFTPQLPRWPTECQVLDEKINHIQYVPPSPEPYYMPNGKEVQIKPSGEECGIVVYQYIPVSAVNYFSRSSVGGSKYLLTSNICCEEDSLKFESRFECGNLARAIRITSSYYELYVRSDLYTSRHMQWFYFRITNMKKNFLYRFSIVNFTKEESLYNEGMKPLMYSTKDSQLHSIGWRRCGNNITYYSNDNASPEDPDQQMTYTLTFTVEFPHEDDEVYLAHCYPYTYSDLEDYLAELSNHPVKSNYTTIRLLCKSLAGNNVHYVTITSPPVSEEAKKKKVVVITARVHPGETPSSWIMKGFLDFLTSDSTPAKELRDKFIFKLVPMLNPDGVIVGNNRCSLAAKDLNRQYRTVMRETYPSIWYTKLMIRRLLEECGVAMYCDLHAHSRKHNIFVYGCENRKGGEKKLQEQVFPLMLHKNSADKFSFECCKFRIQKAKEGTGRVVMWMMGIANSYTMEASFAGSTLNGARCDTHFSTQDYEQMGKSFCQTLLDFYDDDPRKEQLRLKIIMRLIKEGSNADEPTNIKLSDYSSDDGDTSSDTSSNEVGRTEDDEEIVLPVVPPPSPIVSIKRIKSRTRIPQSDKKSPKRKPLPIRKATLGLSDTEKYLSDSSNSDVEDCKIQEEKMKSLKKRRKKKNAKKKIITQSISFMEIYETKSVSVFEFNPPQGGERTTCSRVSVKSGTINSKATTTNVSRPLVDRLAVVSEHLHEVQERLLLLKNKIWYGTNGGENIPLSWSSSNITAKKEKDNSRKKSVNTTDNNPKERKSKIKQEKPTKIQKKTNEGIRRQPTIFAETKIKRSRSLPDTVAIKADRCERNGGGGGGGAVRAAGPGGPEEEKIRKKKKKKTDVVTMLLNMCTALGCDNSVIGYCRRCS